MLLHRIALAKYASTAADAFSGKGGLFGKGRWHSPGRPIVYVAQHLSLAMAESLVHLQRSDQIAPFYRWEIEIPNAMIRATPALAAGWTTDLALTQKFGDEWLRSGATAAQLVPSALVPNELNCLINPAHPDFNLRWVTSGPHRFEFDRRLTAP